VNAGFVHMSIPGGAGALYSTTEDLLRWERGLFGGKLLSAASLAKMTTSYKDDYAFGLIVRTQDGRKQIRHNGGIQGFNTSMAYYPESKVVVIVLANVNGTTPDAMLPKLAAVAHGEEKLGNQQAFPIFPESETVFFLKVVDAQIEFPGDSKSPSSRLILHQNGRDLTAKRLDDAEAKKVTDAAAAFDKRFKDQTAAPGSEAALRRIIEELRAGKPNYDAMSSGLADVTRQQLQQVQSTIVGLGAVQKMKFTGVGPGGADIYRVQFEKGVLEYRSWLGLDGKVESANLRPGQ